MAIILGMSSVADSESVVSFKAYPWFEPHIAPIIERDRLEQDQKLRDKLVDRGVLGAALIDFVISGSTPKELRDLAANIITSERQQESIQPTKTKRFSLSSAIFGVLLGKNEVTRKHPKRNSSAPQLIKA